MVRDVYKGEHRNMAACVRGVEEASKIRRTKRKANDADKVEITPGVVGESLMRRFRAALLVGSPLGPLERRSLLR